MQRTYLFVTQAVWHDMQVAGGQGQSLCHGPILVDDAQHSPVVGCGLWEYLWYVGS